MRRLVSPIIAAAAICLIVTLAEAHDLFLKLDSYFLKPDDRVVVHVLNGTFVKSEGSVQPDRLRDLSLVTPGGREKLVRSSWTAGKTSSTLRIRTGATGTYVIGASTSPRIIRLAGKDFNAYLEEDGLPDVLEARRQAGELEKPARERYHKHVKAIVQVGDARTNAFATVLGYPAELVPLTNPYSTSVGSELSLRCLVDGKPAANQFVQAGRDPGDGAVQANGYRADSAGIVRVPITGAGKWFVKFIRMAAVKDSVDYESKWASLTFEIR